MKLIEFTVKNFKIFKDEVTFSMNARDGKFTFKENEENLLRTALIYGPNASGKSSLLHAILLMLQIIEMSEAANAPLPYMPFKLSTETKDQPTLFEIVFSTDNGIYRYSFSYSSDLIKEEELVLLGDNVEEILFKREENTVDFSDKFQNFWGGIDFEKVTRKNVLVLSKAIRENHPVAIKIFDNFKKIHIISNNIAFTKKDSPQYTIESIKSDKHFSDRALEYMKTADFNISKMLVDENEGDFIDIVGEGGNMSINKTKKKIDEIKLFHPLFNEKKELIGDVEMHLFEESLGTQSFINMMGPTISVLGEGGILIIDEIDKSLHPLLTLFIYAQFQNKDLNKNNAQLVATTHDITLISSENKDNIDKYQIWFTEKNKYGEGTLFCLDDFENLRNDTEYAIKYLQGRFGALPFISSYESEI